MTMYSVVFQNNSVNPGNACIYQEDPDIGVRDVLSLAWFSKIAHPTTKVAFQWEVDYSFIWAETGELQPGVMFLASQTWPADLSTTNRVVFTHEGGAYTFKDQSQGSQQGNLYIVEDATIPMKMASVGVGMSGSGTFAVQAQPNLNLTFVPHPKYWIAFGNYTQGEVLDIGSITNPAEIDFPPGVYTMSAILQEDNSWKIAPLAATNKAYLDAKKKDPEVAWGVG